MSLNFVDVQSEYAKNKQLKPQDVKALMDWAKCQPHLPEITELQAILFLHCCNYSNEQAKVRIDKFFTVRAMCPELLSDRNPLKEPLKQSLDISLTVISPKKTPEGYSIILMRLIDLNPNSLSFPSAIKGFDMHIMSSIYQEEGTSEGYIIVFDAKGVALGHVTKVAPFALKKFLYYIQEAMPMRLKGLHWINIGPAANKLAALMKTFLNKDIAKMLHSHTNLETFTKFVPIDCLPAELGGGVESYTELHAKSKEKLLKNVALFEWEDGQTVDESQRPGKAKTVDDIFGPEGTFKQLEVD